MTLTVCGGLHRLGQAGGGGRFGRRRVIRRALGAAADRLQVTAEGTQSSSLLCVGLFELHGVRGLGEGLAG